MHSVIRLAARTTSGRGGNGISRLISEALLVKGENLELTVTSAVRSMDAHLAVAPLQWICLVCLSSLHSLDARVSDLFIARNGCRLLQRYACIGKTVHKYTYELYIHVKMEA